MDINRREAYYQLIYTLLYCAEGQESEILMVNQHLIDDGLVETMQQVAATIEGGDREGAKLLMNIAADLEAATRDAILVSAHYDFLMQLLQATTAILLGCFHLLWLAINTSFSLHRKNQSPNLNRSDWGSG